jgi:hypothetical protein
MKIIPTTEANDPLTSSSTHFHCPNKQFNLLQALRQRQFTTRTSRLISRRYVGDTNARLARYPGTQNTVRTRQHQLTACTSQLISIQYLVDTDAKSSRNLSDTRTILRRTSSQVHNNTTLQNQSRLLVSLSSSRIVMADARLPGHSSA